VPCRVSVWVMWVGSSVATAPGSMTVTRTSGSSSLRSDSDQLYAYTAVAGSPTEERLQLLGSLAATRTAPSTPES
jgi:hypothetical protein